MTLYALTRPRLSFVFERYRGLLYVSRSSRYIEHV